jgi:hypothetical protein
MPLRRGPLPGRFGDALPVSGLLLLHLPQDRRGRRLRHQPRGRENLSVYNAKLYDGGGSDEVPVSEAERNFCRFCGSSLWLYAPSYPDLVHPFASAIDTPLPRPPEHVRLMLDYAAPWCEVPTGPGEKHFPQYPEESLAGWHHRHGLESL